MNPPLTNPSLPTDSLYKMLAIAGLVLVIAGFLAIWTAQDDRRSALLAERNCYFELQTANAVPRAHLGRIFRSISDLQRDAPYDMNWADFLDVEHYHLDHWFREIEHLQKAVEKLKITEWQRQESLRERDGRKLEREEIAERLSTIQKQLDTLEQLCIQLATPITKHDSAKYVLLQSEQDFRVVKYLSCVLLFIGTIVFTRASYNWYERTQKYQDTIVMAQAKYRADKYPAMKCDWLQLVEQWIRTNWPPFIPSGWIVREVAVMTTIGLAAFYFFPNDNASTAAQRFLESNATGVAGALSPAPASAPAPAPAPSPSASASASAPSAPAPSAPDPAAAPAAAPARF